MPVYSFGNQFNFTLARPGPRASSPVEGVTELNPHINVFAPTITQSDDIGAQTQILHENGFGEETESREFSDPGFHYLDAGIKMYFSDIRIPTKGQTRFMNVKIAGMRRGIQAWSEDLRHGRVKLPVMSISRGNHTWNSAKYSPSHFHPMVKQYLDRFSKVKMVWRPVPVLVTYKLSVWAEFKRDVEIIISQVVPRFNPLAEFRANDGHIVGTVTLRYDGFDDSSDKDTSSEQMAKVKYELAVSAEAWLPLPEQVIPTVLGVYGGVSLDNELIPWNHLKVTN